MSGGDSPLARRRKQTQTSDLVAPPVVRPDPTRVSESFADSAYCPLLHATGEGVMCRHVDCGSCGVLTRHIEGSADLYTWLCSACARLPGRTVLPYWTDGACLECGDRSIVLALCRYSDTVREE